MSKRVYKFTFIAFFIFVLLLLNDCGSLDPGEIETRIQKKLNTHESYKIEGKVVINDPKEESSRSYNIKEWYLAPDNVRLEVFSDEDEKKGQVFISEGDERLQIYNPLIEEKVSLPVPAKASLGNKFSFIFYDKLNTLARESFELEKAGDRYKLTTHAFPFVYEMTVFKDKKGIFGSDIFVEKVNLYKKDATKEPYLTYYVDEVEWNVKLEKDLFDLKEIEEKKEEPGEEIEEELACRINQSELLDMDFDAATIDHPSFEIFHVGACSESGHIGVKYTGPSGNLSFTQQSLEDEDEDKEAEFISSDYENILKWHQDGIKYILIGDYNEKELLELSGKIRDLEL